MEREVEREMERKIEKEVEIGRGWYLRLAIEMVSEDVLVHKRLQSGEEFEGDYSGEIGG